MGDLSQFWMHWDLQVQMKVMDRFGRGEALQRLEQFVGAFFKLKNSCLLLPQILRQVTV